MHATLRIMAGNNGFDPVSMGKRLQKVVLLRGTTLNEIGKQVGLDSGQMSKIARGLIPGIQVGTVVKLRSALGVNLAWLVLGTGEMYCSPNKK